jgi:hypothetical protein
LVSAKAASKCLRPDDLVSGTRFVGFRCFTILDATFVAQVTAFLGLSLTFRGLTVFVSLFLHEASGFLDLTFNAHSKLLCFTVSNKPEKWANGSIGAEWRPGPGQVFSRYIAATNPLGPFDLIVVSEIAYYLAVKL